MSNEESFLDKNLEKELIKSSEIFFKKKTFPSLLFSREIGNMYTPSLYGCLISHLLSKPIQNLRNTRICLFSYGSGSASSMFSIIIHENKSPRFSLENLIGKLEEQSTKLNDHRIEIEPKLYDKYLQLREFNNKNVPFISNFLPNTLYPGTWYLKSIDEKYRRTYQRSQKEPYSLESTRDSIIDKLSSL